jgi:uncharacterized protein (TIGR02996 family)
MVEPELSFQEAIRSGDNAARLIYADWLEEHDRGEEAALLRSGQWCLIPAGSFWMGGGGGKAGDIHIQIQDHYYLGAYTVTQAEWQVVMGDTPSWFSRHGLGKSVVEDFSDEELNLFPVESVSCDDAQEFIKRLNEQNRGCQWLYRLPTYKEWEYACRGAATSEDECSYDFYFDRPTNDLSSTNANFNGNAPAGTADKGPYLGRPAKVGSYPPNRLGLYDMHGNLREWCVASWGGNGEKGLGGSWRSGGSGCRAARRDWMALGSSYRDNNLGFRLARVAVRCGPD